MALHLVSLFDAVSESDNMSPQIWRTDNSVPVIQAGTIALGPASLLPQEAQRYATCAGLVYIQPAQQLDGDRVLVHVAPLPYRLDVCGQHWTMILTTEQLAQTLPYDRRLA